MGVKLIRQMSPSKQSLSKYCNDKSGACVSKATEYIGAQESTIQNVHQRLRDYRGSHGKTSVSKALFQTSQSDKMGGSPSKLQQKTASAFGQNLRFWKMKTQWMLRFYYISKKEYIFQYLISSLNKWHRENYDVVSVEQRPCQTFSLPI